MANEMDEYSELRNAVLAGAISTLISVPIAYLALDAYISMAVSIGSAELIATVSYGALVAVGISSFLSGFFSSYYTRDKSTI